MNIVKAVSLKLLSSMMFALMSAQARYLGEAFPVGEVVFFRGFFALIPILIFFGYRAATARIAEDQPSFGPYHPRPVQPGRHVLLLAALARLPIADVTAIAFIAPLITVIFAALVLKEQVHVYRWSAVAVGFGGVILMLSPYLGDHAALTTSMLLGLAFALTNAVSSGGATIQIRRLTATETSSSIVIFMTLLVIAASLLTAPFGWRMPATQTEVRC